MIEIIKCKKLPPVSFTENPPFGSIFAPHVLKLDIEVNQPRTVAQMEPYREEPTFPGTSALHYGQTIFEGMKAFKQADGTIGIFRADLHAARFRKSANRMMMADFPEEDFIYLLKEYVRFVSDNVPDKPHHSLYLRPLMYASDNRIKVDVSKKYKFIIMSTIAGSYFSAKGGMKKAKVLVNPQFVRAFPAGMGEAKTAANYAASLYPQSVATQLGCDQVLFLDAIQHDHIDELGGMNFFAVRGNELLTPKLNGCILNGVTRRSLIEIAPSLGLKVTETQLSFTDLAQQIKSGEIKEAFACGTAAVVSPIGEFIYQEGANSKTESIPLQGDSKISLQLLDLLSQIQRGQKPAPGNWIFKC